MSKRFRPPRFPNRSSTHACPHPACGREVPDLMWACLEHWQSLPVSIRQDIWTPEEGPERRSLVVRTATERALAFWAATAETAEEAPDPAERRA
jgi:hypothetical protein